MFWCVGDLILNFSKTFKKKATNIPSGQHALNEEYYKRIEAIQFTMNHDDGNLLMMLINQILFCLLLAEQAKHQHQFI